MMKPGTILVSSVAMIVILVVFMLQVSTATVNHVFDRVSVEYVAREGIVDDLDWKVEIDGQGRFEFRGTKSGGSPEQVVGVLDRESLDVVKQAVQSVKALAPVAHYTLPTFHPPQERRVVILDGESRIAFTQRVAPAGNEEWIRDMHAQVDDPDTQIELDVLTRRIVEIVAPK